MMKLLKTVFVFSFVLVLCSAFTNSEKGKKQIYIFGVAASFMDSVVYITDIQTLDSVKFDEGFLANRSAYSYQLKNYIEQNENLPDRTCAVYYSSDKKKIYKEYSKLKNKYQKNKISIKPLTSGNFKFERVTQNK